MQTCDLCGKELWKEGREAFAAYGSACVPCTMKAVDEATNHRDEKDRVSIRREDLDEAIEWLHIVHLDLGGREHEYEDEQVKELGDLVARLRAEKEGR